MIVRRAARREYPTTATRNDRWMLIQQVLDFHDRKVLATANDDVFGSTINTDVPVVINIGKVTGIEPSISIGGIELRSFQIPGK